MDKMVGWRELPQLLGPRVQETDVRLGSILVRFDNDLYMRVEVFRGGDLELRFALFEGSAGTVQGKHQAHWGPRWPLSTPFVGTGSSENFGKEGSEGQSQVRGHHQIFKHRRVPKEKIV
jgi:hypothetical protein